MAKPKLKTLDQMGPAFRKWRQKVGELQNERLFGGQVSQASLGGGYDRAWERNLRVWFLRGLKPEQISLDTPLNITPSERKQVFQ